MPPSGYLAPIGYRSRAHRRAAHPIPAAGRGDGQRAAGAGAGIPRGDGGVALGVVPDITTTLGEELPRQKAYTSK
jgi:hypothetical protein